MRKRKVKQVWNRVKCWLYIVLLQLVWIIPCAIQYEKEYITPEVTEIEEIAPVQETEEVSVEPLEVSVVSEPTIISMGAFKLTAYCPCAECCGKWSGGPTGSGVMPSAGRTIAVDTSIIPFGTQVIINDHTYVAEDSGGKRIQGNEIDIFFNSHEEALEFGIRYAEVFIRR